MKAFISYSHADKTFLKELKSHLVQLRRAGDLQDWSDQEINAGSDLNNEIIQQLENSDIFIALLSPDYISSNYCYEQEFLRALKLKESGKLIIVPIICRPCDWKETEFKNFLAIPEDGKAITEWQNRDTAFFNITKDLRKLIGGKPDYEKKETFYSNQNKLDIKSRYKVQKDFDKIQKVEFLSNSFAEIVNVLKSFLEEISSIENVKYKLMADENSKFSCILVNRDKGIAEAEMTITKTDDLTKRNAGMFQSGDINLLLAGKNEQRIFFVLSSDGIELFFEMRDFMYSNSNKKRYYSNDIANEVWKIWLQHIDVTFE